MSTGRTEIGGFEGGERKTFTSVASNTAAGFLRCSESQALANDGAPSMGVFAGTAAAVEAAGHSVWETLKS